MKLLRVLTIVLAILAIFLVGYFLFTDRDLMFLAVIPIVLAGLLNTIGQKNKK